jgi:hypothetical protein
MAKVMKPNVRIVVHPVLPVETKRVHDRCMLCIRFGSFLLRGVLLSISGDCIRVALEDCGDAAEYRRVENGWVSEFGDAVEIELQSAPESEPFQLPLTPTLERPAPHYCVV